MKKANLISGKFGVYITTFYAGTEIKKPRFDSSTWVFQDIFDSKFNKIKFLVTAARTNNCCESINSALKNGSPVLPSPNDNPAKCLFKFLEFIKFRLVFISEVYQKMHVNNRHSLYRGHSSILR